MFEVAGPGSIAAPIANNWLSRPGLRDNSSVLLRLSRTLLVLASGCALVSCGGASDPALRTNLDPPVVRRTTAPVVPSPESPEPEEGEPAEVAASAEPEPGPLPAAVAATITAIAARRPERRDDAFIKVGDSATVSRSFLRCLSRDDSIQLAGRDDLLPILERFRAVRVGARDPFSRESIAAGVGWSVPRVLRGTPPPLVREVRAVNPRFALIMFGGNDVELGRLSRYESRMRALVERLANLGVVPVLSTIPPRNDEEEADREVPRYNAVIRAIAEERHLPLIDLHAALLELPNRGLASDGVHPSAPVRDGRAQGCDFTSTGLQFGQNVRNLMTLEMLGVLTEALAVSET